MVATFDALHWQQMKNRDEKNDVQLALHWQGSEASLLKCILFICLYWNYDRHSSLSAQDWPTALY